MTHTAVSHGGLAGILWLALGGIACVHAANSSSIANTTERPQPFTVSNRPMVLTRTVHRALSDGQEIITTRSYDIHFTQANDGFRIDGQLHNVSVEAPPRLSAIASIERNRRDDALFPIFINAYGEITSGRSFAENAQIPSGVAGMVNNIVEKTNLDTSERDNIRNFVGQVSGISNGVKTAWPADLFRPSIGQRSMTNNIPLPDGQTGTITVKVDAKASNKEGLLQSLERIIITEMEGQQRLSREIWTLHSEKE